MDQPNVCNTITDLKDGVIYHVIAYRKLSDEETVSVIQGYLEDPSHQKHPAPNSVVTILTVIGTGRGR